MDEALADIQKAIELDPSHPAAIEESKILKQMMKNRRSRDSVEQSMGKFLAQKIQSNTRKKLVGKRGKCVLFTRMIIDVVGMVLGYSLYTEKDYEYY